MKNNFLQGIIPVQNLFDQSKHSLILIILSVKEHL